MHQQELDILYPKVVQNVITGKYAIKYFKRSTQRYIISSMEFTSEEDAQKVADNILSRKVPSYFR